MRHIICVAIVLALSGHRAHADWRDGCPAGAYIEHYTNSRRMGPSPDTDSALSVNRLTTGFRGAYFTSKVQLTRGGVPRQTALVQEQLWHLGLANWFVADISTAVTEHFEGDQVYNYWTGGLAKVGFRQDWFADVDPNLSDPDARVVHGMRKGLALRAVAGARPDVGDDKSPTNQMIPALDALRMPFDLDVLHPGTILGIEGEYRIELVGCNAPFIHARLGVLHDDTNNLGFDNLTSWTTTVQTSVSLGFFTSESGALMAQYAVLLQRLGERKYDNDQRWRIAYDYQIKNWFSAGLHLDYATRYDGLFGGFHISFETCLKERPCTR